MHHRDLGEPRKPQGLGPLSPGPQKMWTCLHSCFISEAGQDTCPTTCLAPPLGDLSQDPPLTWSCLRAFWACSGFLYSTNPNPMDNSAPETDRAGVAPGRQVGRKMKKLGRTKFKGFWGPLGVPSTLSFLHAPLGSQKDPSPRPAIYYWSS